MSKTIEIRLSDVQCEALGAEAEAAGLKFFDHCRTKLLANMTMPVKAAAVPVEAYPKATVRYVKTADLPQAQPDRIDRLEALVLGLAESVNTALAQPQAYAPEPEQPEQDIDIEDVVAQSLGAAERQGLTALDREPAVHGAGGVRHVGTRPPTPFSPQTQPRHLNGLG